MLQFLLLWRDALEPHSPGVTSIKALVILAQQLLFRSRYNQPYAKKMELNWKIWKCYISACQLQCDGDNSKQLGYISLFVPSLRLSSTGTFVVNCCFDFSSFRRKSNKSRYCVPRYTSACVKWCTKYWIMNEILRVSPKSTTMSKRLTVISEWNLLFFSRRATLRYETFAFRTFTPFSPLIQKNHISFLVEEHASKNLVKRNLILSGII